MTEPERIVRTCSRVLAISDQGRVLLLRGHDPARPQYAIWHAPGGGIEPGETPVETAVREFSEEIGHVVEIGPHVWNRVSRFSFNEVPYEQYERYFLAQIGTEFEPSFANMLDYERDWVTGYGWFSVEELREVERRDLLAPPDLPNRLAELLSDGAPTKPVDVGGEVLP